MKKLLAVLMLFCPLIGLGQIPATTGFHRIGQVFAREPQGVYSQVVPYASVTVTFTSSGLPATIYSDPLLGDVISPPVLTADDSGNYDYYIPLNYCVTETITSPSQGTITLQNICGSSGGGGSSLVYVNGNLVSLPNFNSSTPIADSGYEAVTWVVSASNVIAEVPIPVSSINGMVGTFSFVGSVTCTAGPPVICNFTGGGSGTPGGTSSATAGSVQVNNGGFYGDNYWTYNSGTHAANINGQYSAGAACPAKYPSGTVCANVVNGKINPVGYGADPTATSDSTSAITAAVAAAVSTNPGTNYNPIEFPCGDYLISGEDSSAYNNLLVAGPASQDCVSFYYNGAGGVGTYTWKAGSVSAGGFAHIKWYAYPKGATVTALAQNAIIFNSAVDEGTIFDDLSFIGFFGDAVVSGAPTNFYGKHFRLDSVGGYAFNFVGNNTGDGNPIHLSDFTIDNTISGSLASFKAASGYTNGAVATVTIATAGSGMTNGTYRVPATGTSKAPAYALIVVSGGALTQASVLGEGSQYTTAPTFSLANATSLSGSPVALGGTLGTLTATLGVINGTTNGKGIVFCSGCNGVPILLDTVRIEDNSPNVTIGNADEGTLYFNDDSSASAPAVGFRNFNDVNNSSSRHPMISSAQGHVAVVGVGPNGLYHNSSVYKNRSTQQEYGDYYEANATSWTFGQLPVQFQGWVGQDKRFDFTPSASITTNTQLRQFGDWFYRGSDFVPGTNGPIRVMVSPTSGRAMTATGSPLTICTTAVIAANATTGTANITGCDPINEGYSLHIGDNISLANSGTGGSGATLAQVSCFNEVASGTQCLGLAAQGIVLSVAPGCLPSSCPATTTETWQAAVLNDFGLEAGRSASTPSSSLCTSSNLGQIVWNSTISSGQVLNWTCSTPGTWLAGPPYGSPTGITGNYILTTVGPSSAISSGGSPQTVYTASVPASAIPAGGCLRATAYFFHTGSNSVSYQWNFGATAVGAQTSSAAATTPGSVSMLACAAPGSSTAQFIDVSQIMLGSAFIASGVAGTASQNFANPFTVTWTFSVSSPDTVTPTGALFEVLQP